jgi:predicted outer membrane repeat protein
MLVDNMLLLPPATTVVLQHSSFESNSADQGGAVAIYDWSSVHMQYCNFAGNTAFNPQLNESGTGGAAYAHDTAHINISTCNFTGSTASSGGAIYIENATLLNTTGLQPAGDGADDSSSG